MDIFDDEINIIEYFQTVEDKKVLLLSQNIELAEKIYQLVHDKIEWQKWTNSSAKNATPPDFYCTSEQLMMDIMRVDDHESISKKGKVVNPTRVRESEMMKELKDLGIFETFPNVKPIVIAKTDLPTEQDHNYIQYRDCFNRTVRKHIDKILSYKKNHPGFNTIFLVYDESSAYFEAKSKPLQIKRGEICVGKPHLWFLDADFVKAFIDSDIDYLIWYTPYKHSQIYDSVLGNNIELPIVTVIDVKNYKQKPINYKTSLMISTEV